MWPGVTEVVLAGLFGDRVGGGYGPTGVEVAAAHAARTGVVYGLQFGVELVDEGFAGRQVEVDDRLARQAVEMLDEPAQRIAVGGEEHRRACPQVGNDRVVPPGQHAMYDVLQALRP